MQLARMLPAIVLAVLASQTAQGQDSTSPEAAAAAGRTHHLVVAVGGDRPNDFPAARVDQIVEGMNNLMIPNCRGIKFIWDGHIKYNPNLLSAGTDADLEKSYKENHETANVYWVYSIQSCAGTPEASGCTAVPGSVEVVIDDQNDRAQVVWLHERGHAEV